MDISENQEMYLLSIARLIEAGQEGPISLHLIADELEIMPVSANEMIRKLGKEGYVRYMPYKGVELLAKGRRVANNVLRRRRLWEVFLVEKLKLSLADADALACRLEHLTPQLVADRLHAFLDKPTTSPNGKPIPSCDNGQVSLRIVPLADLEVGERAVVEGIKAEGADQDFMGASGIRLGAAIKLIGIGSHQDFLLDVGGRHVRIGLELIGKITMSVDPKPDQGR